MTASPVPQRPEDLATLRDYIAANDSPCPTCGYRLAGLPEPRCPECGKMPTLDRVRPAHQGLVLPGDGALIQIGAAIVAVLAIAGMVTSPVGIMLAVVLVSRALTDAREPLAMLVWAILAMTFGVAPFVPIWIWSRWLDRRQNCLRAREAGER